MGRLEGKTAIVTGGASGIGAAIVALFVDEGANVVSTDIANVPGTSSQRHLSLRHDTTVEQDWIDAVKQTCMRFGTLDILVNNAGISAPRSAGIVETTIDEWRRVLAVNLDGVFLGMKHAMRAMSERGGAIVNVGSVHSFVAIPNSAAYCASKGGLLLLTKAGALEGAALNATVRVNSIHPGYVETPLLASRMAQQPARRELVEAATPLKRLATAQEIASAVLPLVTDETRYMTGAALCIDGGYTAR